MLRSDALAFGSISSQSEFAEAARACVRARA
jgi:hypothetical protein